MASVYKIQIQTVSDFTTYPPDILEKEIKKFLENQEGLKMRSSKVKVKRVA